MEDLAPSVGIPLYYDSTRWNISYIIHWMKNDFSFTEKMESLSWFMFKKKDFNISRVKVGQMGKVPGPMWKWVHYFTVNQLFFACEKYSRDSREYLRREYFSPRTCLCHMSAITIKTSGDKAWSRKIVVVNQFIYG